MVKCSVVSVRKLSAGSMSNAASARLASSSSATAATKRLIRRIRRDASHISEEIEIAERCHVNAGQRALGNGKIGLVPETDVRHVARDGALHLLKEIEATTIVGRCAGLIEEAIDLRVAVVTAV